MRLLFYLKHSLAAVKLLCLAEVSLSSILRFEASLSRPGYLRGEGRAEMGPAGPSERAGRLRLGEWLFLEHAAGGAGQLRFLFLLLFFLFALSRGFVIDFLKIKAKMRLRLGSFALERFA